MLVEEVLPITVRCTVRAVGGVEDTWQSYWPESRGRAYLICSIQSPLAAWGTASNLSSLV